MQKIIDVMAKFYKSTSGLSSKKTNSHMKQDIIAFNDNFTPFWTPRMFKNLAHEGYKKNVIAYRAINLIAKGMGSVQVNVYDNESKLLNVSEHPLANLLKRPNKDQPWSEFIENIGNYLLMSGNAYVFLNYGEEGDHPSAMHLLRPDRVKIKINQVTGEREYEYGQNIINEYYGVYDKKQVLHFKFFNPLDDIYGLSPIEAAAGAIDQHNAVSAHNLALLQNGGRPSGCLIFKNKDYMTQEQKQSLRENIKKSYEGAVNAGRTMVLEGDFEWKEMGLSPKDLDFVTGKIISSREIAQAFGVPPMLVGISGDTTFSNYREARYHLWEDTILPLLDSILNRLNDEVIPQSKKGELKIEYNEDDIHALSLKRESVWKRISDADFLTINEKRQALGFAPIGDGDNIK